MPENQGSTATQETRVPIQVQRRADAARRIEAALRANQGQPGQQQTAPVTQPTVAAVVDEPADADVGTVEILSKDDPRYNDPNYWMKRGKTMTGMLAAQRTQHDAEVAGLHQMIGELRTTVSGLQRQLAEASRKPALPTDFLTQEQIDLLGPEQAASIVTATEKQIKTALESALQEHLKPLQEEREAERKDKIKKANDAFFGAIRKSVPQFDALNTDPAFHVFFNDVDPTDPTGRTRSEISRAAEKKGDPLPCINILKAYLKTLNTPPTADPVVEPASVPGAGQTPTSDVPAANTEWMTTSEITKGYTDLSKRKASDAEIAAFTAKVNKAKAAGKIRKG